MQRRATAVCAAVLAATSLVGAVTGDALGPAVVPVLDRPAVAPAPAQSVYVAPTEVISISERRGLSPATKSAADNVARALGVVPSYGRGFSVGMRGIRRGDTVTKQSTGTGWGFPVAVTALPLQAIGTLMGRSVSGPVSTGIIVLSESSAAFHNAVVGDQFDLFDANMAVVSFTVGLVLPDAQVGGAEILMSYDQAAILGASTDTRIMLFGNFDHGWVNDVLWANGLVSGQWLRVSRSWDSAGPDDTLSLLRTKQLLGEFDIYYAGLAASGWVARNPGWSAANLPGAKRTYPGGVSALCHNTIHADLDAALAEVLATMPSLVKYASGISNPNTFEGINVTNSNQYGGCATSSSARLSRISSGTGNVSRHSWGQAIDVSTIPNCQGCVPKLNCDIVRIFRKHNFAWGGNFLEPDGMHFEWVGEQRNLIQTNVNFCDNNPLPPVQSTYRPPPKSRDTLFADDGWMAE
ncbi:MAG: M15 family metallopeptidase [Actinomycetota bacterium]|nr:M15 family metallopeptidase [Actinomycetota bacterium]